MKKKTNFIDIEEIKRDIIFDFIRYKATGKDEYKNSILHGLKQLCKHYHVNIYKKASRMEDFDALNIFLIFICLKGVYFRNIIV